MFSISISDNNNNNINNNNNNNSNSNNDIESLGKVQRRASWLALRQKGREMS